jgi:nitroreductase
MSFVIENTREFLKSHNFDPAQAEISLLVIVITTFVLFKLITASNKSSTITQVLTVDRRSVENYKSPASRDSIMTALKCAIHAPNHFLTEPWRFRLLGEGSKAILGDLAAKFKEGGQFGSVPDYIVVSIAKNDKNKGGFGKTNDTPWNVNSLEDHAATACAVQNFMISCASQGIGTKWMTGKMGISPSEMLTKVVEINEEEEYYMGCLLVGIPSVPTSTMKVPCRKIGLSEPVFTTTK